MVTHWIRERTREEVLVAFSKADLPVGSINSMEDLARDEHIGRTTTWVEEGARRYRQPTRVLKLAGEDEPSHAGSPALGEHTFQVLRDVLGYDEGLIESLANDGATGVAAAGGCKMKA